MFLSGLFICVVALTFVQFTWLHGYIIGRSARLSVGFMFLIVCDVLLTAVCTNTADCLFVCFFFFNLAPDTLSCRAKTGTFTEWALSCPT